MSFVSLLDKTAIISRLQFVGDKESYSAVGSFACHFQQLSPEEAAFIEGVYGKTFSMYCGQNEDIKVSDDVEIDGANYKVKAKKEIHFGRNPHLELIIVLPDD